MPGTLLQGAYQTPQKKERSPKVLGEKAAKGGTHTQVGELDDEMKEPSPAMKAVEAAHREKVEATRKWVSGEMTTRKHDMVHKRADHIIKNPHRYFGKNKGKQSQ